jgi:hypothetical protein
MRIRASVKILAWLVASILACGTASAASLSDYFGAYVGVATVEKDEKGGAGEVRDIDLVISPYKQKGFRVEWVAVYLVDGRRDVPGVKRRKHEVLFEPGDNDCCFVQVGEYDPFRETEALQPMLGEPVRWAVLDEHGLKIYSFAILEDGDYELQSYTRSLTEEGVNLLYERIKDGVVMRRITGHTVRTPD